VSDVGGFLRAFDRLVVSLFVRDVLLRWVNPARPSFPERVSEPKERRALTIETFLVLAATLGYSAVVSLISLADSYLRPEPLAKQSVALNAPQAEASLLDLLSQLAVSGRRFVFGALGLYLLWRGGIALYRIGLDRTRPWRDLLSGVGLTALIGVPGLGLYLLSYSLGFSLNVQPSVLDDTWWRTPMLIISAASNAWIEEVLIVAYLLTRVRQLGWGENAGLLVSAVIRGSYHLYQGPGGFVGNFIMGLIFGRIWQRTNRIWPLVIAHTLLDVVSFVGYALLAGRVSWL
jgi:membrane protease YdiL (CAAX protease family)